MPFCIRCGRHFLRCEPKTTMYHCRECNFGFQFSGLTPEGEINVENQRREKIGEKPVFDNSEIKKGDL